MTRCPDAAYGLHGDPNTKGRCPWCHKQITARRNSGLAMIEQMQASARQRSWLYDVTDLRLPRWWRMQVDAERADPEFVAEDW